MVQHIQDQEREHANVLRTPISAMATDLQELLSRRVTAYIVGVKDAKTITRWASREVTDIRQPDVERRLRATYAISRMLLDTDGPQTVKAWFLSMNPYLDDVSPAEAIRNGHEKDAMAAARAFVSHG